MVLNVRVRLFAVYMKFNDIHYNDVVHGVESLADQVVQRIGDVKAQIQGWTGNKPTGQPKRIPKRK